MNYWYEWMINLGNATQEMMQSAVVKTSHTLFELQKHSVQSDCTVVFQSGAPSHMIFGWVSELSHSLVGPQNFSHPSHTVISALVCAVVCTVQCSCYKEQCYSSSRLRWTKHSRVQFKDQILIGFILAEADPLKKCPGWPWIHNMSPSGPILICYVIWYIADILFAPSFN